MAGRPDTHLRIEGGLLMPMRVYLAIGVVLVMLPSGGCVNAEFRRYHQAWPAAAAMDSVHDLAGVFANRSEGPGRDSLWEYLTGDWRSRGDYVSITVVDEQSLLVELWRGDQRRGAKILHAGADYRLKDGRLIPRSLKGVRGHPLGSVAGYARVQLFVTEGQGLGGRSTAVAAGLVLHVVPGAGFGRSWAYWPARDEDAGAEVPAPDAAGVRRVQPTACICISCTSPLFSCDAPGR